MNKKYTHSDNRGGFFKGFKNCEIEFTTAIKKLCLYDCHKCNR